jgi:thymidylate synthase (FAD)
MKPPAPASFGPKRTTNDRAERYFANLSSSGHGSVYEHASFSFLCYGISRSTTHEVVRHRAGTAYSQLSQRYVSGKVLRFVERPEYQEVPALNARFQLQWRFRQQLNQQLNGAH